MRCASALRFFTVLRTAFAQVTCRHRDMFIKATTCRHRDYFATAACGPLVTVAPRIAAGVPRLATDAFYTHALLSCWCLPGSFACHFDARLCGVCHCARPIKPIERLVPVSFTHCCASTPGLSTWWSSTVLKRILVSRGASRLDAFSGYPFRT